MSRIVLTAGERQAALRQITAMDKMNTALSMTKGRAARRLVPIIRSEKEIWVAVNPITNTVSANVPQPKPGRQALCSGENNYGNTCYCYADQLPISIFCTLIFAVISAVFFTPLSLFCCIPMVRHLWKVRYYSLDLFNIILCEKSDVLIH